MADKTGLQEIAMSIITTARHLANCLDEPYTNNFLSVRANALDCPLGFPPGLQEYTHHDPPPSALSDLLNHAMQLIGNANAQIAVVKEVEKPGIPAGRRSEAALALKTLLRSEILPAFENALETITASPI